MGEDKVKTALKDFQEIVRRAIMKHTEVDVCFRYEQRRRYITDARDMCCQILRDCNFLYREIAEYINIDNARISVAIKKVNDLISYDKDFKSLYIKVIKSIHQEIGKHITLKEVYQYEFDKLINDLTKK